MKHSYATNDLHNQLRLEQTFKPDDPVCRRQTLSGLVQCFISETNKVSPDCKKINDEKKVFKVNHLLILSKLQDECRSLTS